MSHRLFAIFLISVVTRCVQAQPGFLVVDKVAQKARDDDRLLVLQTELANERDALTKAQAAFTANASPALQVEVHRRAENVKALQREIGNDKKTPEPARVVIKAIRPSTTSTKPVSTVNATGRARFWDPYNRSSDNADFSTREGKEMP